MPAPASSLNPAPSARQRPTKARTDFLESGFAIIAQDGHATGLTIARVCALLGVSKGSFYWHFHNRDDYVRAMLDHWAATAQDQHHSRIGAEANGDLRRLIAGLIRFWQEGRFTIIDRAMRRWAEQDPIAAEAVANADLKLHKFLTRAFRDAGIKKKEAARRARLLIALGVAEPSITHLPRPGVPLEELTWLIDRIAGQ